MQWVIDGFPISESLAVKLGKCRPLIPESAEVIPNYVPNDTQFDANYSQFTGNVRCLGSIRHKISVN